MNTTQASTLARLAEHLNTQLPYEGDNAHHESIWQDCRSLARYVIGIMLDIEAGNYTPEAACTDQQCWYDDIGSSLAHSLDQYAREIDNEEETD